MAVTLAQAKLNTQDALQLGVIDEFQKSSYLLQHIPFDNVVSPTGGGTTLTYGYTRLITQPTAQFRAVNEEYSTQEVEKKRFTVDLKVFGGAFEVDRVISNMGGIVNEVTLQMQQKVKAASSLFSDTVINGDSATNAKAFDGLDVALAGSDTEFNSSGTLIDLSTAANIKNNADEFLFKLHKALGHLDGKPHAILGNSDAIAALQFLARYVGHYQTTQNQWGQYVGSYNGIPLIDLGAKAGSNDPIIGNDKTNGTSLYFVRFGMDAFHAISPSGQLPVRTWLPDFSTAGAVKKGEVEMVAAVALKTTHSCGVFRKLKVA